MKINQYNANKRLTFCDLEKVFNIQSSTIRYRLRSGMTLKEALETPVNSYIHDLTGERFHRLLVQYTIPGDNKHGRKCHCLCDCGNECDVLQENLLTGKQKSCGCLNMQNRHNRHKDMSGQIINGVKLIQKTASEIDCSDIFRIHYLCECPFCGSLFDARYSNIVSGNTKGCGCTRHQYTSHIDLVGRDFEYCHVNKRLPDQIQPSGGSRVIYECTCCCGKKYTDWAFTILHGRSNCGCKKIMSKGEEEVKAWLDRNSIPYIQWYRFDDLRGKRNMPYSFDFAIFDDEENLLCLIEYQGEQHYHELQHSIKDFGKEQREVSDPAKRKYCKDHHIKLFEIAYNEDTTAKCEEIFHLLYHDNTVPSTLETA